MDSCVNANVVGPLEFCKSETNCYRYISLYFYFPKHKRHPDNEHSDSILLKFIYI